MRWNKKHKPTTHPDSNESKEMLCLVDVDGMQVTMRGIYDSFLDAWRRIDAEDTEWWSTNDNMPVLAWQEM